MSKDKGLRGILKKTGTSKCNYCDYIQIDNYKIDQAEADILKLVPSEEQLTANISFKLGELHAKGLHKNYPETFNKLIPKMGEAIHTLIIKKMTGNPLNLKNREENMCPLIAILHKRTPVAEMIKPECIGKECEWWIKQDNRWDGKEGVCAVVLLATKKE